jgi:hypothetical protein
METTQPEEPKEITDMIPREPWHSVKGSIDILNTGRWQPESLEPNAEWL